MGKEKVTLNDGTEFEIDCLNITGRRAFQLGPKILVIKSLSQGKGSNKEFEAGCDMNSSVDICWDYIVAPCPQRDQVCATDMQRIFEKYAKKEIDFVVKKNMENLSSK